MEGMNTRNDEQPKMPDINNIVTLSNFPQSVEEAGALLGATITTCGKGVRKPTLPPIGMHSSFTVYAHVPSSELMSRLYDLRALLRASDAALSSAPSILAVLMKLIGVSTSLAAAATTSTTGLTSATTSTTGTSAGSAAPAISDQTPPLLSNPLRKLWIDCVVLCHTQGTSALMDVTTFVRKLLATALLHPRSQKAAGGVRLAALQCVAALLRQPGLASRLAPWALEVFQAALKAVKSTGNGEPTYRLAAVEMSVAAAVASRVACLKSKPESAALTGAVEEKALQEAIKLVKVAVTDKYPEVRRATAEFVAAMAPFWLGSNTDNTFVFIEDVMVICQRNLDDDSPHVLAGWAEGLARCLATVVQHHSHMQQTGASGSSHDDDTGDGEGRSRSDRTSKSHTGLAPSLTSVKKVVAWLVDQFVKVGGEMIASRAGGTYSIGGRAVRLGYTLTVVEFFRLQYQCGAIGQGRYTLKEALVQILGMAGTEMEKQLRPPPGPETTTLFGSSSKWSKADPTLVQVCIARVLRRGLSELASEPVQLQLLQELLQCLSQGDALNSHQLQVVLIESSHLFSALGEAAASKVEETLVGLKKCLSSAELGVRYEAAITCTALAQAFPDAGRQLIWDAIGEIQHHHAQLLTYASSEEKVPENTDLASRVFRRTVKEKPVDRSLPHQYSIHGFSLVVAMLSKVLPKLPGGLPNDLILTALTAAELMVSCQHHEKLCSANSAAACLCVRAGYSIMSGILSTGPSGATEHVPMIFDAWSKSSKSVKTGELSGMQPRHDLFCIDAVASSIVVFLKYNSKLLLSIPEALSHITILLEDIFSLFVDKGRFHGMQLTPPVAARFESAQASLLEAFAWLPSGSFPMVADDVFAFAANHIREAVDNEIPCSILHTLLNKEDAILDAKTFTRAKREEQVSGSSDLEESLIFMTAEVALQREREAIFLMRSDDPVEALDMKSPHFLNSRILGQYARAMKISKPPTPLHEVGTWRRPFEPSYALKVRIVDAAIQAFAATFGLKDSKQQQDAMLMLESMMPPLITQLAQTLGVNASLTDQTRRSKAKEDSAAAENITAVLLTCLQALPMPMATHNVPIGPGPPWMNKARELLLTLLPSASSTIRRASAEGLALLATVGVSEDGHFLQSTVLHSLDEVMQGNKPDGKPRPLGSLEPVSAARAASLLTLACIQRTNNDFIKRQAKSRMRTPEKRETASSDAGLPVLQMMTRMLPSVSCHGFRDYFIVRTYAMHSFAVLVAYSKRLDAKVLSPDGIQLLRKGIEIVEENFAASWALASYDLDRGQEAEKLASEVAFLSVLLRLMTYFIPHVHYLRNENPDIARRFCTMTALILDAHFSHPAVFVEGMAFYEVMCSNQNLLAPPSKHVLYTENPLFSCVPAIMSALEPVRPSLFSGVERHASLRKERSAVFLSRTLVACEVKLVEYTNMGVVALLTGSLEYISGSVRCGYADITQTFAVARQIDKMFLERDALQVELCDTLAFLLSHEKFSHSRGIQSYLRWILYCRSILVAASTPADPEGPSVVDKSFAILCARRQSAADASYVLRVANPVRWQVKTMVSRLALWSLEEAYCVCGAGGDDPLQSSTFNYATAESECSAQCRMIAGNPKEIPVSYLVFHVEELLPCVCVSSVASLDHAELFTLQEVSAKFLRSLIKYFSKCPDPHEPNMKILDQFTTQFFSVVKHATSALDENPTPGARRLFVAGCEVLDTIIENRLSTDPVVMKRLLRPLIPMNLPILSPGRDCRDHLDVRQGRMVQDSRSAQLPMLARLWTVGKSLSELEGDHLLQRDLANSLFPGKTERTAFAIHCAIAAIDGSRLLHLSSLSVTGILSKIEDKTIDLRRSGFFFKSWHDIDDSVRTFLVSKWASLAHCSIHLLLDSLASIDDREVAEVCTSWVKLVLPLLLAGIEDVSNVNPESDQWLDDARPAFARFVDTHLLLRECIRGVSTIVMKGTSCSEFYSNVDVKRILTLLDKYVIRPVLCKEGKEAGLNGVKNEAPISEVCELLYAVSRARIFDNSKDPFLLLTLLHPLDLLEKDSLSTSDDDARNVVRACLRCLTEMISRDAISEEIMEAILKLVSRRFFSSKLENCDVTTGLRDGAKNLLLACLGSTRIDRKRRCQVANTLLSFDQWDVWKELVTIENGSVLKGSAKQLRRKLSNFDDPESQCRALGSIRSVMQCNSELVGCFLHDFGAEVLGLLDYFGAHQNADTERSFSLAGCADAIKILLIAHQVLYQSPDQMVVFLECFFGTLLSVLRYNGVPTHPTSHGDSALGRICAQAILHIARSSPEQFKLCLFGLSDHDRQLAELAVRSEMSGYAMAGTEQSAPKRKINLQGFKK